MSKYAALREYLNGLKSDHWNATFIEIEDILGFPLPSSARRYPAWWANQNPRSHVQCSGWLDAGWRTSGLNLETERVTLLRSNTESASDENNAHKPTKSSLEWNDVLNPRQDGDSVSLNVTFSWQQLGNVFIDQKDRLAFPRTPISPAIYRFMIKKGKTCEFYIGETDEISRRLQHYRTPGVTQRTNRRLTTLMKDCLGKGGSVEVAIIENANMSAISSETPLDLSDKLQRRLIEHAAIVSAQLANDDVLNL